MIDLRKLCYEEIMVGSSWYAAGKAVGLEGHHMAIASRAQRLVRGYARAYGREWPEDVDARSGQDAFHMVGLGHTWVEIAKELDYTDASEARSHATAFAGEGELNKVESLQVGKVAYHLRADDHLDWKDIGVRLDQPYLKTKAQARSYAKTADEPWPIRRGKDPDRGRKAYELKQRGLEWDQIATKLGCGESNAYMRARVYAENNGRTWPLRQEPHTDDALRQLGGRAYRMREAEGCDWPEIGKTLSLSQKNAIKAARLFADLAGERWPIIPGFDPNLGEKAYTLFIEERLKWDGVAERLGWQRGTVIDRAKKWARDPRVRKPWPPTEAMDPTGKLAYEMKAAGNVKWRDIAERLNRTRDFVATAARDFAIKNNLTWPISLIPAADPHLRRFETGRQVYELRQAASEWVAIIDQLGISMAWAHRTAREYANWEGLEWPISIPGMEDTDQEAYELRLPGISWNEVAEKQGCSSSTAHDRARRHAKRSGRTWPINVAPVRRHFSPRAKRAFELGYGQQMSWNDVALEVGYASGQSARNCAQVYAHRFGLPYPRQNTRRRNGRDEARLQQAYELRRDTDLSWAAIGKNLGYMTNRSSFTAALKWAGQNNLPWPPRQGVPDTTETGTDD